MTNRLLGCKINTLIKRGNKMTQNRVYNFSAGPAVLPVEVLETAQKEMLNYQNSGMSVMEMSHRSKTYDDIIKTAEKDLRELLNIPDNYKVLFLQGGAHLQFSMVPINLLKNGVADYIVTIYQLVKMQIMFIFVKTIQFMEQNSTLYQIQKVKF